jgi:hypothetical protein
VDVGGKFGTYVARPLRPTASEDRNIERKHEEFEQVGVVTSAEDRWATFANGLFLGNPDDASAHAAACAHENVMLLQYIDTAFSSCSARSAVVAGGAAATSVGERDREWVGECPELPTAHTPDVGPAAIVESLTARDEHGNVVARWTGSDHSNNNGRRSRLKRASNRRGGERWAAPIVASVNSKL